MAWLRDWAAERDAWKVEATQDYDRIKALPLLSPQEIEGEGRAVVQEYSEILRKPGSTALLKWPQALALHWLYEGSRRWEAGGRQGVREGVYCGLPPGVGKTLITMLAPVVLDVSTSVLIMRSGLHAKTSDDFARYQRDWEPHYKGPTLLGLEALSRDEHLRTLDNLAPKLVMFDECDEGRNLSSAAMVRLERYRAANPDVAFMLLTGSGMRFGIEDYDVHICWCLPGGSAPIPYDQDERELWREALRSRPKGRPDNATRRPRAGALLDLCALPNLPKADQPRTELEAAQSIVARRINGSPGVLIIDDDDCRQPMTIRLVKAPDDPIIDQDFANFYGLEDDLDDAVDETSLAWCLPNGEPLTDGLAVWRALRSMGCGYYEFTDPPPPEEYAIKRRKYHRKVRTLIAESAWSNNPADTPKAVKRVFPDDDDVIAWEEVQRKPFPPTMKPFKRKTSLCKRSASVINYAARWLEQNEGLVWCASVPLGRWIAERAGVRYYGAGGEADDGARLSDRTPASERAVVSIKANSRGLNLQANFCRGLVVQLPQSADECHQLFKRYHRFGQSRPVHWDILIASGAARYSFDMTLFEARLVKKQRRQTQTILRSEIVDCTLPPDIPRWFRKPAPT